MGISFAYIKASEGATFVDPSFAKNWASTKDAGIAHGAYHLFRPARPVCDQATNFVRTIGLVNDRDLPPALDLEEVTTHLGDEWDEVPEDKRVPTILEWLLAVETQLKCQPILYIRRGWVAHMLPDPSPLFRYRIWIAHCTDLPNPVIPTGWEKWTFWQYTASGSINGIDSAVDLDKFNGLVSDLFSLLTVSP